MAEYKGASREGGRAASLMKKREQAREEMEKAKEKIVQVRFFRGCHGI